MPIPSRTQREGGLIVSVQAPEGSPMRHPDVIAAMAEASLRNGATGVRLESPEHIGAVRNRCPNALIIGLWKRTFPESSVYITPRWDDIQAVWAAGADVIALDATARQRPEKEDLASLIQRSKEELGAPLMADVDSIENGLIASSLGCEWVGTTLYGYTEQTSKQTPPGYRLISPLRDQLPDRVTLICEGGIKSPDSALQALEHGADLVVVGTAITGVDLQVADYIRALDRQSG
jgi:N-acylglucosamine-6-phosphate 2-epimerase